jgi:SAM-dependent methyltransferase
MDESYLETIYSQKKKPFTEYPKKLINYLCTRFDLKENDKLLEIGCGRGDFLNEFKKKKLDVYGVDQSDYSQNFFSDLNFKKFDITKGRLPFEDNFFDVIYSKSFIEHLYFPEIVFKESYRVLKPGGKIITLTPEWPHVYRFFYEDYTHRVPFTKVSLMDIHEINKFKNIELESFIQLPILFEKNFFYLFFKFLSVLTRILVPDRFRMQNKWIRFSKEIMLLSIARK